MMLRLVVNLLVAPAGLLAIAGGAEAATVLSQPLDSSGSGAFSNLEGVVAHQQVADNFTLGSTTALDSLSWSGGYPGGQAPANPVGFSIRFFSDAGGAPGLNPLDLVNVAVTASNTGLVQPGGSPWFSYSTSLSNLTLAPGAYWVSILESDARTPASGNTQWLWGQSNTANPSRAIRGGDGVAWTSSSGPNMAFTLTGTAVPEPPSFVLGGLAALILLAYCGGRHRWAAA
jgi:hypothetical protein